jgi:uncharacterized protein YdcH (DUF465 family)
LWQYVTDAQNQEDLMPVLPQEIRAQLMESNPEFQRLATEHSRYEVQLEQLTKQTYMNAEDLIQQVELKKRKLRVKDEMERLVAMHQREVAHR